MEPGEVRKHSEEGRGSAHLQLQAKSLICFSKNLRWELEGTCLKTAIYFCEKKFPQMQLG